MKTQCHQIIAICIGLFFFLPALALADDPATLSLENFYQDPMVRNVELSPDGTLIFTCRLNSTPAFMRGNST